jgi:predicted metal-dependent RNase
MSACAGAVDPGLLAQAARDVGIAVGRSQVRRILLAGKMRWRRIRSWATSTDPESVPQRTRVVEFYTAPPSGSTVICADEPGLVIPRTLKAAVNLLVGRDWLTGPLGRKEHASQRSTTGLNELGRQYR